jgi:polypeptide N-acetylgalactosaminyltransferase
VQLPDDVTRNKSIEFIGQTLEAIKFMRKLLDYQSNNETSHAVREQVVVPVIDDKKNEFDAPGEMGKGLEINRTKLLPVDIQKYDDGLEKNAFNVFASDLISTHRSLPDVRNEGCRKIKYKGLEITASIVMCFYNEAWSVLLRSINSIIDRSPRYLLKEIILVDDFSDLGKEVSTLILIRRVFFSIEHLKQPLDDYIKSLRIVRLIRQKKREGLIRSRLTGAAAVKGDVIIFLDSHIEVTEGWLEPLLDPISQNRTTVVTPIIDTIDDMTLRYHFGTADLISVGGFNWNLQFTWHALPEREKKKRKHPVEPVRSPTMAGGLFAISKKYFNDLGTCKLIGTYCSRRAALISIIDDSGMDIWGGENLEISFRIWMCGG